jgi:hypothetical protein
MMNINSKIVVLALSLILLAFSTPTRAQEICGVKKVEAHNDGTGDFSILIEVDDSHKVSVQNAAKLLKTERNEKFVNTKLMKLDLGREEIGHITNGLDQGCVISRVDDEDKRKWVRVEMHRITFGKPPIHEVKFFEIL